MTTEVVSPSADPTDNYNRVQGAIRNVGPGGRVVLLPYAQVGKYLLSNTLEVDSSIILGGENDHAKWDNNALPWLESAMTASEATTPLIQLYSNGKLFNVHIEPNLNASPERKNSGVSIVGTNAEMRNVKIFGSYNGIATGTPYREEYNGVSYRGGGNGLWKITDCYVGHAVNNGMFFHRVNSWSDVLDSAVWFSYKAIECAGCDWLNFRNIRVQGTHNSPTLPPTEDWGVLLRNTNDLQYCIVNFDFLQVDAYNHPVRLLGYAAPNGNKHRLSFKRTDCLSTYSFMVYHANGAIVDINDTIRIDVINESCIRLVGGLGREYCDVAPRGLRSPNPDKVFCSGVWEFDLAIREQAALVNATIASNARVLATASSDEQRAARAAVVDELVSRQGHVASASDSQVRRRDGE